MLNMDQTVYLIGQDHQTNAVSLYRMGSPARIGNADLLLKQFATETPTVISRAFTMETPWGERAIPVFRRQSIYWCSVRLTKLPLRTMYRVVEPNADLARGLDFRPIIPVFQQNNQNTAFDLAIEWPVPTTMNLFFGSGFQFHDGHRRYQNTANILFATYKVASGPNPYPGCFQLPFPNQFDDGRVCLGAGVDRILAPCLADAFKETIGLLNASRWNHDQLSVDIQARAAALFRLHPETNAPLDPPLVWTSYCRAKNHHMMEAIANEQ